MKYILISIIMAFGISLAGCNIASKENGSMQKNYQCSDCEKDAKSLREENAKLLSENASLRAESIALSQKAEEPHGITGMGVFALALAFAMGFSVSYFFKSSKKV